MTEKSSPRREAAERIAEAIRRFGLTQPYGGDVSKAARHYVVGFAYPRNLDGTINVYSTSFIHVEFQSRYSTVPHHGHYVFTSVEDAVAFLKAAFVDFDQSATDAAVDRAKKREA